MRDQIEGSLAIGQTVARCRPELISAYPISPQTHIVEALSDMVWTGELEVLEMLDRQVESYSQPAQHEMGDAVERAVARDRERDFVRDSQGFLLSGIT